MHNIATNNLRFFSFTIDLDPTSGFSFKTLNIMELTLNSIELLVHREPVPYNFPSVVLHSKSIIFFRKVQYLDSNEGQPVSVHIGPRCQNEIYDPQ